MKLSRITHSISLPFKGREKSSVETEGGGDLVLSLSYHGVNHATQPPYICVRFEEFTGRELKHL
jgi:hypothetical protein